MNRTLVVFFIGVLILSVGALSGCSSKGSGKGQGLSEAELAAQRDGRFGDGSIPTAEGEGMFRDIFFAYDSSDVSGSAMQDIEYNLEVLKANPNIRVSIEGHADMRGTSEYNLALGDRRARSVLDILASNGTSRSNMEAISYGEEVPLDPGSDDAAMAKNRRVHLSPMGASQGRGVDTNSGDYGRY